MAEAVTQHLPDAVAHRARATARRTGRQMEDVLTEWLEWVVTSEDTALAHAETAYPLFTPYGNEGAAQALLDALASAEAAQDTSDSMSERSAAQRGRGKPVPTLDVPVRFYSTAGQRLSIVKLHTAQTGFILVDCDGQQGPVIDHHISPALQSARRLGLKVVYFYDTADGIGGPDDITRELHADRHGKGLSSVLLQEPQWSAAPPVFAPAILPLPGEPVFPKASRDGFQTTRADTYFKTWGVDTLIAVGFALRSCLYHTCLGARDRNYRVIMLRDCTTPPGEKEFSDTRDATHPEGGWMRAIFVRQYEADIGYTSTAPEFVAAARD